MNTARRAVLLSVLAITWTAGSVSSSAIQEGAVAVSGSLTPEQMEDFLLHARIIGTKGVDKGITNTRRATLSDGRFTHDAQIQTVDISQTQFTPARGPRELNFRDSYRFNIAAYRLARLLGLDNVPMSVPRRVEGTMAAVTWWIDDVAMDEGGRRKQKINPDSRMAGQIHIMRVFDELIQNTDRNLGNLLWAKDGTMWMIDHTRAFRFDKKLKTPGLLTRCERHLLERMRALTFETVKREVGDNLTAAEIEALIARRNELATLFDGMIAQRGESAVLYTLQR